jgi:hypothetical protein
MFRAGSRFIASPALRNAPLRPSACLRPSPTLPRSRNRYLSTAPPAQKSRSFKSLVARLGLAGAIVYYYNTTDVFAEEPRCTCRICGQTKQGWKTNSTSRSCPSAPRNRSRIRTPPHHRIHCRRTQTKTSSPGAIRSPEAKRSREPTAECPAVQWWGGRHGRTRRGSGPARRFQSRDGRDQLGLPVSGWHGRWALRPTVQSGV